MHARYPRTLVCRSGGESFEISTEEAALRARIGVAIAGHRFSWPDPTLAPRERHRRRLAFRNESTLYRARSSISGAPLVSSFSKDKPYKVCSREEFSRVDNREVGRPFDFNRTLFEQFAELHAATVKPNVVHDGTMQNSDFTHFCGWSKDCYLMFNTGNCEGCSYGYNVGMSSYVFDSRDCTKCSFCYEVTNARECYELWYSSFCKSCHSSAFLTDCIGCHHCLGCIDLRNQEYCVLNQPVGKTKFEAIWKEVFNGSYSALEDFRERYEAFLLNEPKRCLRNTNVEDCDGDVLVDCQNVHESYNVFGARNAFHCYDSLWLEESMDISMFGRAMSHCYELSGCGATVGQSGISNCTFSSYIFYGGYDVHYSMSCNQNSKYLFACADLRGAQYCILNQQYSKEEYQRLLPQVIAHMQRTGEWGEFFPLSISPYGYNESLAFESMPLSKEEAEALGANWSEYVAPSPQVEKTIAGHQLPDVVEDYKALSESLVIRCATTGKPFKLTSAELAFYERYRLPLPRIHPTERQRLRRMKYNPYQLRDAVCCVSGETIKTSYPPTQGDRLCSLEAYEALQ